MTSKENLVRTIRFGKPKSIPMNFHINNACWNHYDQETLKDLIEAHPLLFPGYERPQGRVVPEYLVNQLADSPWTDPWGCVWETSMDGITGTVHQNPLKDWDGFESFRPPSAEETDGTYLINWNEIRRNVELSRKKGKFVAGGLPHGHTFLKLHDLRGYTNLLYDMVDEVPNLLKLIEMISDFNYDYIMKWIELEPDMLSYPEDLGMQVGPMLSPNQFRQYIKPVYQRCMKPARDRGILVHMHSDGDIRDLADDLIDGGVEAINLQDLVNGIDWIADKFSGKVCVDLDIDRQKITPFGTPAQIDALIREEVEKIGTPDGGLMMTYGLYPKIPLPNVKAVMDSMERYMGHYA
jgi:hypothetical protein